MGQGARQVQDYTWSNLTIRVANPVIATGSTVFTRADTAGTDFPDTDLVEYIAGSPSVDKLTAGGWHLDAKGLRERSIAL